MANHEETRLHMACVNYLRGEILNGRNKIKVQTPFVGIIWLHPVNEFKDEKEAFWGKAKGILPGVADLLFYWQGGFGAIELKAKDGYARQNQKDFKTNFEALGGRHAYARSVVELRDALISWGLTCKNMHAIEPKLTKQEQIAAQYERSKPVFDAFYEELRNRYTKPKEPL